jgi:FixJ family two-component response regulator/glycine cleavage system H lipoate-binding protein
MATLALALFVIAIVLFILLNLAIREFFLRRHEKLRRAEREAALADSLKLDFTRESKTLKRVVVESPRARILCVEDEETVLDAFRRILVLDGYSIDTVESGPEALGLIQTQNYDFVFTDLKMPSMSGVDLAKSVKHLRPDIDVVIITGFASVESAVECMKQGAMDYIEKPFTEEGLRDFVGKTLIRRQDRIEKQLKPRVHVMSPADTERVLREEFSIPGGVLVSFGHCWASLADDGTARVGLDDFARKLLGRIDSIDFPHVGQEVDAGQPLFSVRQGERMAQFHAPLSGKVVKINGAVHDDCSLLEKMPYGRNWVCVMEGRDLDSELPRLKIGKSAVALFQEDIERVRTHLQSVTGAEESDPATLSLGAFQKLDDAQWRRAVQEFFGP